MNHRTTVTAWYRRAAEILSDGEWHDGRSFLVEVGKVITPGVAQRKTEQLRSSDRDAPSERVKPLPLGRQIEQGKRYLLTEMVRQRTRSATWETDPPYPMGHTLFDADRPWRVRLLRGRAYVSVPDLADRFDVSGGTIRRLRQTHGLPAEDIGRKGRELLRIQAEDLPLYEQAIKEWKSTQETRLSGRNSRAANTKVNSNISKYLTEQLGPSTESPLKRVRRLVEDVARLRHDYAELRAENYALREKLAALEEHGV